MSTDIDIVFDGPPGHEGGRFVEVEDGNGRSIKVGEWLQREDGYWVLRLSLSSRGGTGRENVSVAAAAAPLDDAAEKSALAYLEHAVLNPCDAVAETHHLRTLKAMLADKDAAYLERNQVVAALASIFPSGIARTDIPGWLPEWHGCVYIDLPTGQASWHYHDSHAHLFAHLPPYAGSWDGHTTDEKYERLALLTAERAQRTSEHPSTGMREALKAAGEMVANEHSLEMMHKRGIILRALLVSRALLSSTGDERREAIEAFIRRVADAGDNRPSITVRAMLLGDLVREARSLLHAAPDGGKKP